MNLSFVIPCYRSEHTIIPVLEEIRNKMSEQPEITYLGDGFSTFQLTFGDKYEGNIFTGEDLIANSVGDKGFMTLQVKGDEAYSNGVKKFLGVDTLKTTINNQEDVFGAGFALDSIRKVLRPNELCKHFKFVVNLQNDSIAMFVAGAPILMII